MFVSVQTKHSDFVYRLDTCRKMWDRCDLTINVLECTEPTSGRSAKKKPRYYKDAIMRLLRYNSCGIPETYVQRLTSTIPLDDSIHIGHD
jgi:hypothetical protein